MKAYLKSNKNKMIASQLIRGRKKLKNGRQAIHKRLRYGKKMEGSNSKLKL
jgi:hypothetical protein